MADQKITDLATLTPVDNADWVPVVDVSDTTDGPDGTTKKALRSEFKGDQGDAGEAATIAVGNVSTVGPADPATIANVGTPAEAVFDFEIPRGETGGQGAKGINWQGDWSAGTYEIDDAVQHDGSSWIATVQTNEEPSGAATDWDLLAEKGDAGAGSGDMLAATYDPQNISDDAFDTDNHTNGTTNKVYTATEKTKLAGIEAAADVTDAGNVGSSIHGATGKTTPVDADTMPLIDSAASNVLKKVTWANVKATLKAYFDTLYDAAGAVTTHAAVTATHGATGAVVGTTNSQTLTNKTLTAPVINSPTGIAKGDVGLGNVDNTSNATERAASATLTNKTLTSPSIATPTITSEWDFGAHSAGFTETDNGNSSTADTIDWRLSNKQKSTLTGNCTFTFTAPTKPCSLVLKLVQDGTGSRTATWPAAVHWAGGTPPTLTTTLNKVDIITFYYDGATYFGNSSLNYTA